MIKTVFSKSPPPSPPHEKGILRYTEFESQGVDNGILWNSTNTVYVLSAFWMFPIFFL